MLDRCMKQVYKMYSSANILTINPLLIFCLALIFKMQTLWCIQTFLPSFLSTRATIASFSEPCLEPFNCLRRFGREFLKTRLLIASQWLRDAILMMLKQVRSSCFACFAQLPLDDACRCCFDDFRQFQWVRLLSCQFEQRSPDYSRKKECELQSISVLKEMHAISEQGRILHCWHVNAMTDPYYKHREYFFTDFRMILITFVHLQLKRVSKIHLVTGSQPVPNEENSFVKYRGEKFNSYREVVSLNFLREQLPNNISMEASSSNQASQRVLAVLPKRVRGPCNQSFRHIDVTTNHYQVKLKPADKIVVFRLKFTPPIPADNRKIREQLFDLIRPNLSKMISNPVVTGFNVYSTQEGRSKEESFRAGDHEVNVRQVKVFDISTSQTNPKVLLHFLNSGLRNVMGKLGFMEIGRSGKYFNCRTRKEIDNLFMYSGFKANFVKLEAGFFLRVDSAKKVVRNETVLNFIDNFYKQHDGKDKDEKRQLLKQELANKIVMANYGKFQYYKVINIQFKKAEEVLLEGNTNMLKYFADKYHIQVKQPSQPLLEVDGKRRKDQGDILLFPELCLMTGIPENFDEMRRKKISESAIKNPPEKVVEIHQLMGKLKDTQDLKGLKELGIQVNPNMQKFRAKAVPVPRLQLGSKNAVDNGKEAFFNLFNKPIYQCKHSIKCALIHFKGVDVQPLLQVINSTKGNLGVDMKTDLQEVQGRGIRDLEKEVQSTHREVNICLIVLPGNMKNDYKKLKLSAIKGEMVTQVVTEATLRKKNLQSIATKVLLQIIAKRGNILWVPETSHSLSDCMLLAFDTAKAREGTILSACATINSTFSSLHTRHKYLKKSQQKFEALLGLTLACVHAYSDRNNQPPKEILMFLNSCTGDQVSIYQELFLNKLVKSLQEIYPGKSVCVTTVMVNLKNCERFFTQDGQQFKNVPAGTLISDGMVSQNYDFFLVSQQSNRGSTVPNHYRVIFCNSKVEEGVLQELIFGQCFNYVNWTGSIKVPAVLQYAKKCAKFTAQVMEKESVPETLMNKPYFV